MNIFEDLIEELKEENLIEQTVIETNRAKMDSAKAAKISKAEALSSVREILPVEVESIEDETFEETPPATLTDSKAAAVAAHKPPVNEADFYRQKAMNEVTFLQMVEAAFASVEREQLKIVPLPFNDLSVKKVLQTFLQACSDSSSPEFAKAEFQLMQETENWYSSLSLRDNRMITANLRRFLETSRPQLSSPALVALARFYRNSPYSEAVRAKFDLVITRLFSKDLGYSKREMIFNRDELLVHLKELYADWSSVPLYSTETGDAQILQFAKKFEDFIVEAESAVNFDELINKDFYNRLRIFKESINENFYAPEISATAIECNVRVGNRYVELLEKERGFGNIVKLENKYGLAHDSAISEATGKTFALAELVKQRKAVPKSIPAKSVEVKSDAPPETETVNEETKKPEKKKAAGGFNVWLLVPIFALIAFAIFYFGTKTAPVEVRDPSAIPKMDLENSMLREYLQEARIEDDTLKGIVLQTWNHLTDEKRKDVLKQMLNSGADKGYKKVQLVDQNGKTVGTAANGNVTVSE